MSYNTITELVEQVVKANLKMKELGEWPSLAIEIGGNNLKVEAGINPVEFRFTESGIEFDYFDNLEEAVQCMWNYVNNLEGQNS